MGFNDSNNGGGPGGGPREAQRGPRGGCNDWTHSDMGFNELSHWMGFNELTDWPARRGPLGGRGRGRAATSRVEEIQCVDSFNPIQ